MYVYIYIYIYITESLLYNRNEQNIMNQEFQYSSWNIPSFFESLDSKESKTHCYFMYPQERKKCFQLNEDTRLFYHLKFLSYTCGKIP